MGRLEGMIQFRERSASNIGMGEENLEREDGGRGEIRTLLERFNEGPRVRGEL